MQTNIIKRSISNYFKPFPFFLLFLTISAHAQDELMVLHHHGNIKVFAGTDMSIPINEAADGDTLFLNPGTYSSPSTITKCVSIIGSGAEGENKTIIPSNISFNIPSSSTTDSILIASLSSQSIYHLGGEGLKKVYLQKASIYQLEIGRIDWYSSQYYNIVATIDRSITQHISTYNESTANCYNSIFYSTSANGKFTNCYVHSLSDPRAVSIKQTYLNSILYRYSNSNTTTSGNMFFQNCLFAFDPTPLSFNNCYTDTSLDFSYQSYFNNVTEALLKQGSTFENNQYFGIDGTIVGCYGGKMPFSLELHSPEVVSHNVTYDKDKSQMNVNVKFQAK